MESDGFVLYERLSGGVFGARGETYRIFLEHIFDELAVDLGVLFDRRAPQSLVFPRGRCLEEVLSILNNPGLIHLWKEDETIGWIYQYFNSKEERDTMRAASASPRNSRELAVRNQFFTPRYVVEFLVDNTLGRIWYEMRKGDTALKDACRYLVRRPAEIFLKNGEQAPAAPNDQQNVSHEELLKQKVYILYRPKKDPRDLKILDPACGSGHFLLYAFDLLEAIYEEAWSEEQPVKCGSTGKTLRDDYPDLDGLKRALPELVLRHNLHGIDIDLRACQIAALALWLRAQRTYQRFGFKPSGRPQVKKSNIVCAEPMPGEQQFLDQFVANVQPRVLGQLVQVVFEKMKLAGEAGSLLKIEDEIAETVADAKKKWLAGPKPEQTVLFGELRPRQTELSLDFSGITDEAFWEKAEERIYTELQNYAERAQNGHGYQRRLFAEDAARGFAFVDLSRKRYDAVLMNPPFGECSLATRELIETFYELGKADLFACFLQRGVTIAEGGGMVGAITSRLALFVSSLEEWREQVFFEKSKLCALADLGHNVLDTALVEAAAYVCCRPETSADGKSTYWAASLLDAEDKEDGLKQALEGRRQARFVHLATMTSIPGKPFAYWIPEEFLARVLAFPQMADSDAEARVGLQTDDDFRFLRLAWEINYCSFAARWKFISKGGEYSPFYDDLHLVVDWGNDAASMRAFIEQRYSWTKNARSVSKYGQPGLTYSERTTSELSLRPLPGSTVFSIAGPAILAASEEVLLAILALGYTRLFRILLEMFVGGGDAVQSGSAARHYKAGILNQLPLPRLDSQVGRELAASGRECAQLAIENWRSDESSRFFAGFLIKNATTLMDDCATHLAAFEDRLCALEERTGEAELKALELYGLDARWVDFLRVNYGLHPSEVSSDVPPATVAEQMQWNVDDLVDALARKRGFSRQTTKLAYWTDRRYEAIALLNGSSVSQIVAARRSTQVPDWHCRKRAEDILSYCLGIAFGRWDIGFATGEKKAPDLPHPFAPLSVSSPGMLQSAQALPLTRSDVEGRQAAGQWDYPLEIPWDGILVDDVDHPDDVVRRVRKVLTIIWKERAEAIEQEACETLATKDLGEYFRKPSLFFADHLKRYSKSRRQAPIYWPLSTASGSYTLWIYYHRLNDDLLYTALNKYVKPKIDDTERELRRIEAEVPNATGREASDLRNAFERTTDLIEELREFRDELALVAELPYKPDLNDGVLITASPLWKLFRLLKWRKDLEECWRNLAAGEFDWAQLAYSIWPERVREACRRDRSIAIAHGLEALCEVEAKPVNKKRSNKEKIEQAVLGEEG
jgi:hypothetical protein